MLKNVSFYLNNKKISLSNIFSLYEDHNKNLIMLIAATKDKSKYFMCIYTDIKHSEGLIYEINLQEIKMIFLAEDYLYSFYDNYDYYFIINNKLCYNDDIHSDKTEKIIKIANEIKKIYADIPVIEFLKTFDLTTNFPILDRYNAIIESSYSDKIASILWYNGFTSKFPRYNNKYKYNKCINCLCNSCYDTECKQLTEDNCSYDTKDYVKNECHGYKSIETKTKNELKINATIKTVLLKNGYRYLIKQDNNIFALKEKIKIRNISYYNSLQLDILELFLKDYSLHNLKLIDSEYVEL